MGKHNTGVAFVIGWRVLWLRIRASESLSFVSSHRSTAEFCTSRSAGTLLSDAQCICTYLRGIPCTSKQARVWGLDENALGLASASSTLLDISTLASVHHRANGESSIPPGASRSCVLTRSSSLCLKRHRRTPLYECCISSLTNDPGRY